MSAAGSASHGAIGEHQRSDPEARATQGSIDRTSVAVARPSRWSLLCHPVKRRCRKPAGQRCQAGVRNQAQDVICRSKIRQYCGALAMGENPWAPDETVDGHRCLGVVGSGDNPR
jgi:hypothetical protein